MIQFLDISNTRLIELEIGKPFGFFEKLKMKGIGSPRIIYLEGLSYFDECKKENADQDFVNFELYPKGIVARYSKRNKRRGIAIKSDDITKVVFTTSYVLVQSRSGFDKTPQATVDIHTTENDKISFFVPPIYYKSTKPYWEKSWLNNKLELVESKEAAQKDKNSKYIEIIEALSNL